MIQLSTGSPRVLLDARKLALGRGNIQGFSGSGKSNLFRLIFEGADIPCIIIDPEGEYSTLREQRECLLVGKGGELPCAVESAAKTARGLLELAASAVVNISGLPPRAQQDYVAEFLMAMIQAPRQFNRPTIVAIDEAPRFCPQSSTVASSDPVRDVAARGRKRGYGLLTLAQRYAQIDKNVTAEAGNQFIGKTRQKSDRNRALETLGLGQTDDNTLLKFQTGEFFALGDAIDHDGVVQFTARLAKTDKPPLGQTAVAAIASSDAVSRLAESLRASVADDTPATLDEALATIDRLQNELDESNRSVPTEDQNEQLGELRDQVRTLRDALKKAEQRAANNASLAQRACCIDPEPAIHAALEAVMPSTAALGAAVKGAIEKQMAPLHAKAIDASHQPSQVDAVSRASTTQQLRPAPSPATEQVVAPKPKGPATQRVLWAMSWWLNIGVAAPDVSEIAFVAGISPKSSTIRAAMSELKNAGLVDYGPDQQRNLTKAGREQAPSAPRYTCMDEYHQMLKAQVGGGTTSAVFEVLVRHSRDTEFDQDELAEEVGVSPGSSTIRAALATLRKLGLVRAKQPIRPTALMFPKELL